MNKRNYQDARNLRAELAKSEQENQNLITQLAVSNELNQKLSNAFQWLESHYKGFCVEKSFIQHITLAENITEAQVSLESMLNQDGFCGGRIITCTNALVKIQTFWKDDKPPSSWMYLGFDNMILPDGMRHVFIMPSQYAAVGIIPSRVADTVAS